MTDETPTEAELRAAAARLETDFDRQRINDRPMAAIVAAYDYMSTIRALIAHLDAKCEGLVMAMVGAATKIAHLESKLSAAEADKERHGREAYEAGRNDQTNHIQYGYQYSYDSWVKRRKENEGR